jgi:FKBP-type peptidyl-prolyl cis-trans isomerase FkpA
VYHNNLLPITVTIPNQVLKIVKLSFLKDKRITLPIEIAMHRIPLICLILITICLAACQKSDTYGPVQIAAQAATDQKIINEYLTQYGLTSQFKHVDNVDTITVYYRIVDSGATNTLFTNSTEITVGDTGMILSLSARKGPLFYETDQFHPTYALGSLIKGWQLGVPEVGSGGEVELIMASRYAYGPYAQPLLGTQYGLSGGLPANSILDFYIRLYAVTN